MLRMVGAAILGLMMMLTLAMPAAAFHPEWCEDDPVFTIDGQSSTVTTRFALSELTSSTNVSYVLYVSPDASVSVSHSGPTNVSSTVTVVRTTKHDGAPRLQVSVSGDHAFQIQVAVSGSSSFTKTGSSEGTHVDLSADR